MSDITAAEISAEQFGHKVVEVGLLEPQQLEAVWGELGTRAVTAQELESHLLRRGLLTNLQVDKLIKLITKKERWNFFYGKYKVMYLVGEGSFARVYRAVNTKTGEVFALKVLRNRHAVNPDEIKKFLIEARMVMQLRHPNIVPIFEVDTERGRPYMVMEFVEGQNLREMVRARKRLTVEESLRLIGDVCSALEFALTKNMTHRDLKLSNVLVTSLGRGKLVDFGLAALAAAQEQGLTQGMSARSVHYAGLERATGVRKDDPRSDIYFAGCMLYHMLSGHPPLAETNQQSQLLSISRYRDVEPITKHAPDLPRLVINIVAKAMDLNADRRYQTPSEMAAEIKHVVAQLQKGEDGGQVDPASSAGPVELEGANKTVMVIEGDSEMQNTLRELLKKRGYRVLVMTDPDRAIARFEASDEPLADAALIGTKGLKEQAFAAFQRFGESEKTRNLPLVLLVDEEDKDLARSAQVNAKRILLYAPLKVRDLRAALLKLIKTE